MIQPNRKKYCRDNINPDAAILQWRVVATGALSGMLLSLVTQSIWPLAIAVGTYLLMQQLTT